MPNKNRKIILKNKWEKEPCKNMLVIIATDNQEFALLPTQVVALAFDPAGAGGSGYGAGQ